MDKNSYIGLFCKGSGRLGFWRIKFIIRYRLGKIEKMSLPFFTAMKLDALFIGDSV
jgi:hypothetical protein